MGILNRLRESAANRLSGGKLNRALLEAQIGQEGQTHFRERLWELESALLSGRGGMATLGAGEAASFSRLALREMHRRALVLFLKNPLIRRGVFVQSHYVFAQGVSVRMQDDDAQAAWDSFWDDEDNRRQWTSPTRLAWLERKLMVKGNLFALFFVDRVTGLVQIREIDVDEIEEILPVPTDATRPAFYKRVTTRKSFDAKTGTYSATGETVTEYFPDWHYRPKGVRPIKIGGHPVHWDQPMAHFTREQIAPCTLAPSSIYSADDWASGYTRFLENRATVAAALAKITLKFISATKAGAKNAKEQLMTRFAPARDSLSPNDDAGGNAYMTQGQQIEAVNVKGATINPDEGRRLQLMICASFGFGETFFGDVSVGTLATAQSLDRPTELAMTECQVFWKEVLEQMARFVLLQAAKAPANAFSRVGKVETDKAGREYVATLGADGIYRVAQMDVDFPPLLHHDVQNQVNAIVAASKLVPLPKLIARHALNALGEDDLDEALRLLPDDVELKEWPAPPVAPLPKIEPPIGE